ncbi:MAG: hypothetical protein CL675_13900 [Bdellovibrionaceae bacterium]|nr:hypothetical protein [Pseudobdellovibrionaceae bacterium]
MFRKLTFFVGIIVGLRVEAFELKEVQISHSYNTEISARPELVRSKILGPDAIMVANLALQFPEDFQALVADGRQLTNIQVLRMREEDPRFSDTIEIKIFAERPVFFGFGGSDSSLFQVLTIERSRDCGPPGNKAPCQLLYRNKGLQEVEVESSFYIFDKVLVEDPENYMLNE